MHLGLVALVDFADLSFGMIFLHAFTFDPGWIPARRAGEEPETIHYDGDCGLCHCFVRLVLAEDNGRFRFAPLGGDVPEASVRVTTADGGRLLGSQAVLYVLARLGGLWRVVAWLLERFPRRVVDGVYRAAAGVRRRLAPAPGGACPIVATPLRARFVAGG